MAVIDDDPDIVKVNMMMLKSRGYEAIAAHNGKEGLKMVGRETPDVVLLDITMPGEDGIETCRRLKSDERTRDIPLILVTATTSEEYFEEALAAGGNGFPIKPFRPNELFEIIEEVCDAVRTGVLSAEHTREAKGGTYAYPDRRGREGQRHRGEDGRGSRPRHGGGVRDEHGAVHADGHGRRPGDAGGPP